MPHARIARLAACLMLAVLLPALSASADDKKPSFQFNLFSVEGLVVGKTITIDKAYGEEHHRAVPAPFSFVVPLSPSKEYEVFFEPEPAGDSWIRLSFATADRQLIENIQFVPLTVDMGDLKDREQAVAQALINGGLPTVYEGRTNTGRDSVRAIKIGDYDAVEVIAHYDEPKLGRMYARLVGIINPKGTDGVAAIANIVLSRVPVKTVDDFAKTRGGALLTYFKYL